MIKKFYETLKSQEPQKKYKKNFRDSFLFLLIDRNKKLLKETTKKHLAFDADGFLLPF